MQLPAFQDKLKYNVPARCVPCCPVCGLCTTTQGRTPANKQMFFFMSGVFHFHYSQTAFPLLHNKISSEWEDQKHAKTHQCMLTLTRKLHRNQVQCTLTHYHENWYLAVEILWIWWGFPIKSLLRPALCYYSQTSQNLQWRRPIWTWHDVTAAVIILLKKCVIINTQAQT